MSDDHKLAITRDIPRSLAHCQLTFIDRAPIDVEKARQQHDSYCTSLERLGLDVVRLPADEALPDCCFVEDTAVVLDEVAILTSLGAPTRRGESHAIEAELRKHRPIARIELPATIEGGDVFCVGRSLFVGHSTRTNAQGIEALKAIAERHGYDVHAFSVSACLHLKSAVTPIDDETLLADRKLIDLSSVSKRFRVVDVEEEGAANVLRVRGQVWSHVGYPRTIEALQRHGCDVKGVDISEFVKAEGALTCKSLLLR